MDHFMVDWQLSGPKRGVGAKANVRMKATAEKDWTDIEVVEADAGRRLVEESRRRAERQAAHARDLPPRGAAGRRHQDQLRARDPRDADRRAADGPAQPRLREADERQGDEAPRGAARRLGLPATLLDSMRLGRSLLVLGAAALLCRAGRLRLGLQRRGQHGPTPTGLDPVADLAAPDHQPTPSTTAGGWEEAAGSDHHHRPVPAGCSIPDAYQDFKFTGVDCTAAVAVATAWDQDGKDCNTVDNPNVDEGYHRTCSVEGFTCTAKRDVHSDDRFVSCTQGGQSIRFTWLPAVLFRIPVDAWTRWRASKLPFFWSASQAVVRSSSRHFACRDHSPRTPRRGHWLPVVHPAHRDTTPPSESGTPAERPTRRGERNFATGRVARVPSGWRGGWVSIARSSAASTARSTARPPPRRPRAAGDRDGQPRLGQGPGERRGPEAGRAGGRGAGGARGDRARASAWSRTSAAGYGASPARIDTVHRERARRVFGARPRERRPIYAGVAIRPAGAGHRRGVVYGSLLLISAAIAR